VIHPVAWVSWVGAIVVILSVTRNPWYVGLVLAWIALVLRASRGIADGGAPIPISPVRFGVVVVTLSALFNALTVHFGDTVLFHLPAWLPLFGGPVTLEAVVFGMLNGLVLTGLFAAFSVFNQVLPVRAVVRLIPQAFFPVAVVISVAVTFVPVTLQMLRQIREAQAVRGHRMRGLRDWLPLVIPLLVGGMERALQLAEAMTARGFAGREEASLANTTRLAMVAGLILVLGGWLLRLVWTQYLLGGTLLLGGVGVIGGTLWREGRRTPRTMYRPAAWRASDWVVLAGVVAAVVVFFVPLPGRGSIFYYPYPVLTMPQLSVVIGLGTVGLLAPVWVVWPNKGISEGEK
jgi:energy-coupling factor transport system permease protein